MNEILTRYLSYLISLIHLSFYSDQFDWLIFLNFSLGYYIRRKELDADDNEHGQIREGNIMHEGNKEITVNREKEKKINRAHLLQWKLSRKKRCWEHGYFVLFSISIVK